MKLNFAKRMSYIKASEIREILKVTEQEDVISFAGGLPAPELFPIDEINEINQIVLKEAGTKALQYTKAYGCSFIEIPTDEDGMMMDVLEEILSNTPHIKLIYAIPTFQNPTGKTWSLERRRKLAELSAKYGVAVIEDNPYGELRFEGESLPSIKSFDEAGSIQKTQKCGD